jgi:N6-L-threonylcarbamoyladenine synthase
MPTFAVAGGVAANTAIRSSLMAINDRAKVRFVAPPLALCTDNGAMIAYAGLARLRMGDTDGMDLPARPRWPLDSGAAAMLGSGKKGAKA